MTCQLSGPVYNKHCPHCMVRKIKALRSPDGATSKRLQLGTFAWMGAAMARKVKDQLKKEIA